VGYIRPVLIGVISGGPSRHWRDPPRRGRPLRDDMHHPQDKNWHSGPSYVRDCWLSSGVHTNTKGGRRCVPQGPRPASGRVPQVPSSAHEALEIYLSQSWRVGNPTKSTIRFERNIKHRYRTEQTAYNGSPDWAYWSKSGEEGDLWSRELIPRKWYLALCPTNLSTRRKLPSSR